MPGELKKMKIKAKDQPDLQYIALINPESYSLKYGVAYNPANTPMGNTGQDKQWNFSLPPDIQMEFWFDSTGIVPTPAEGISKALSGVPLAGAIAGAFSSTKKYDIIEEITLFKKVVYDYDSAQHSPRTVQLSWGTLFFEGKLTNLQFNFKLFQPDGTPIRVVASATFTGSIEDDLRVAKQKSNSPDLTHIREVKKGDTLPLMTFKIYGDSSYYPEVARVNNLTHFRNLTPGTKIKFPPLNKS
jgi:hypothetical protein